MFDSFSEAFRLHCLTISLSKNEVLHQPAPNSNPSEPNNVLDCTQLKNVDTFKYLESTISSDGSLDKKIASSIKKASQTLRRLDFLIEDLESIRVFSKEPLCWHCQKPLSSL